MSTTFELWDVETGNIVGEFSSVDAALDIVQSLLDAYGPVYADALALQHRNEGATARNVASGRQLVDLIGERSERTARVSAPVQSD
jgi:hypothetical protein